MARQIKFFDTTLRDGEQSPGCSMNLNEKIEMALQLEKLGVDIMEAGFAIASPGDLASIQAVAQKLKNVRVCSLARCVEKDIDVAWEGVRQAVAPRIHVFLATSPVHMKYKLRLEPEQVLEQVRAMVAYAKKYCPDIEFSAEDAMRSDPAFLAQVFSAAVASGATVLNIPDTVGYATPTEMYDRVRYMLEHVRQVEKAEISVHCHNDLGMAVANSIAAITAGAVQVECTVNGIGERAGNASLEEIAMAIHTRKDLLDCTSNINTTQIYRTSRLLQTITGVSVAPTKAIVGANAFAHEAGIHQHGVMAEPTTYEIMSPQSVGIPKNNIMLGKHSGRHAVEDRLSSLGYDLPKSKIDEIFEKFKVLADKKKAIMDKDLEALIDMEVAEISNPRYTLSTFVINSGNIIAATARVTLVNEESGEEQEGVSTGSGPIDAAYNAINHIIGREITLDDYQLRALTEGEDALGDAVVKLSFGNESVIGRGVSTDVIDASIQAYVNGINRLV